MFGSENTVQGRITFLNVGTKILLKDTMDQYLRTLGDFKTHFAPNMASALRIFAENHIHVVITEVDLGDGSAFRLLQELGAGKADDDLYVILALEERSDELLALAKEMEANTVLVKPFAAADLKTQVESYKAWRILPKDPWQLLIHEARLATREKKFREAEENYLEARKCAPNNPVPHYKAGLYYLQKPDLGLAEAMFKKAISINPEYVQAISALGTLYLNRRDLDKGEEYLKRAHAVSPLNPERMVELVRLYLDRAVETCKSSLRLDSGGTSARFHLGKLLATQKDYIGAVRELEKILPSLKDDAKNEAQTFIALSRKLGSLAR